MPADELPHAPKSLSKVHPSSEQRRAELAWKGIGGGRGGGDGGGDGGGGPHWPHWQADVSRLQEIMRPAAAAPPALEGEAHPPAASLQGGNAAEAPFRVVNVFSSVAFAGNPTCVCFVPPEIAEARAPAPAAAAATTWMSKVARELAQPTTSFVEPVAGRFRTFSSSGDELPMLSGHSSLGIAAAMSARTGERRTR